ncbi:hypothetical protein QL285_068735 [Trifolium repens]|nr:hypothetical protein QL285_068735 [Trifolium repens]
MTSFVLLLALLPLCGLKTLELHFFLFIQLRIREPLQSYVRCKLSSYLRSKKMVMTDEERARFRRQIKEDQSSQGNVDARDKDLDATTSISDVDSSAHLKKKQRRKKTTGNEKAVVLVPIRISHHVSPQPTARVAIPTGTSTLPANNWRAKLAIDDRGGESQSAWDVHFSGEEVIPHYTTSSDVKLIQDLGFEQSLEAVRAYGLWSASLATETSKTLKEERSRYLSSMAKLRSSLSQAECSELESKLKMLQISDKEKDKRLEGNARELERKDKQIYALERSSLEEHDHGFSRAVEQLEILHPGLDASGANTRFIVREGQVVDPKARSTFGVVTDHRNT